MIKKIVTSIIATAIVVMTFSACGGGDVDTAKISTIDDLKESKIAVQETTTGDQAATKSYPDAKISRFKKAIDCGVDLKNKKVDAVVIDEMVAKKIVEQLPELMILDEKLTEEEYAIAVKKGNKELLDSINKTLKRISDSGEINDIYNAFIPPKSEQKALKPFESEKFGSNLVMGTNAEFEPFEYRDGETIVGYDVEIAKRIAFDMGKDLKIEDMNFDSLIAAVASGKIDMAVAGMSVDEERLKNVDFSDSYFSASQVVIIRKSSYVK